MTELDLNDEMIEEVIEKVATEKALPVVEEIKGKENVSEFEIAEDLDKDIKEIRNTLYQLYESNLVKYEREKDTQKGWYIYYWTLRPDRMRFLYKEMKEDKLEDLEEKLETLEEEQFFICPNECTRMDFEQVVNFDYRCPECDEMLEQEDKESKIENVQEEIKEIENELEEIEV